MTDAAAPPVSRRRHPRFAGPFDGRRRDLLPVPLRIFDLSVGGCLIESHQEQPVGHRFSLEIELPVEGWIPFDVQVLYNRDGWFAVHFVDMYDATRTRLERALGRLTPSEEFESPTVRRVKAHWKPVIQALRNSVKPPAAS